MPVPPEYDDAVRLQHEIETFGFPVSRHPLDPYRERIATLAAVEAREIGRAVRMAGWVVTDKLTHTEAGAPMGFLTLEDTTGLYEAALFPEVYRRDSAAVSVNGAYVLDGSVEDGLGAVTLHVQRIRSLDAPSPRHVSVAQAAS